MGEINLIASSSRNPFTFVLRCICYFERQKEYYL